MLRRFRVGDPFFPWLCGIASQVTREARRSDQRRSRHQKLAAEFRQASAAPPDEPHEPDMALRHAINELCEAHRDVVLLRYYGHCSCKEVAERLKLPLGTVTKRLSRAHAELRELLSIRAIPHPTNPEVNK
jgi:RNA polymerase sigma-70 factor (ECF subfamily)